LVEVIVGVVDRGAIWTSVLQQVTALIVGIVVDAAVAVYMLDHVHGIVAEEPFLVAVGVDDAIGVALNVVVVLGFVAQGVHDVGKADVLVPLQAHLIAAIVCPFVDGFGIRSFAQPFQVHRPASV
jgi:hypothetical protein